MSKKTRGKSPKLSLGKSTRAPSKTSAKNPSLKPRGPSAGKPSRNTRNRAISASTKPSQELPPKAPSSSGAGKSVQRTRAGSTARTANPSPKKARASAAAPSALSEGAKAPSFRLPRDGGGTVSLGDFAGRKLVLFFYPRADTPGCTKEAIDFTRLSSAFAESQTAVLGVSADPPKAQEAFRNKHELSVPLASDEQHAMLQAYGVWGEKSMYGRTFLGILRTTVLIGTDGRIIRIWRNVRVDGHADEVLAAAKTA